VNMRVDGPKDPVNPRRRYAAPRRLARAQETRDRITAAARHLFASRGYGLTTMTEIAGAAKVAPQTVYAVFGSKLAILTALLDDIEVEAEQPLLLTEMARARGDIQVQIALVAAFMRRLF
jgi:AcrR family transcriptional regulator